MSTSTNSQDSKETAPKAKAAGNKKVMIIGFSVVLIAIIVVGFVLYGLLKPKPAPEELDGGNLVVGSDNVGEIGSDLQQQVADGMYEVTMNTIWNFDSGTVASSDAYVANVKTNTKSIYFDVAIRDSGETVYTSPVIPVGSELKELTLSEPLAKGTYDAVCTYHLLDEELKEKSSLAITVTLNIQN